MRKKISYKKIIGFEFRLSYIDQQSYAPTIDKLVFSTDALLLFFFNQTENIQETLIIQSQFAGVHTK